MNIKLDFDVIDADGLNVLHCYLYNTGWFCVGMIGDNVGSVWRHLKKDDVEVLLPERVDIKDFRARMNDLFVVLGEFQGKAPAEVYRSVFGGVVLCANPSDVG